MARIFDDKTDREHAIMVPGVFLTLKPSLPRVLHPLFDILEVFRQELVRVYQEYEESFDGSIILRNVEPFHLCLEELARAATQVEILDFPRTSTVDPATMVLRPLQSVGDGQEEAVVNASQGVPGSLAAPEHGSNGAESTATPLEKRKASGPLDLPATKKSLYSEHVRF